MEETPLTRLCFRWNEKSSPVLTLSWSTQFMWKSGEVQLLIIENRQLKESTLDFLLDSQHNKHTKLIRFVFFLWPLICLSISCNSAIPSGSFCHGKKGRGRIESGNKVLFRWCSSKCVLYVSSKIRHLSNFWVSFSSQKHHQIKRTACGFSFQKQKSRSDVFSDVPELQAVAALERLNCKSWPLQGERK